MIVVEYGEYLKKRLPDRPDGTVHRDYYKHQKRLAILRKMFGKLPASHFGPRCFREFLEVFIHEGCSRRYVNEVANWTRTLFRWALGQELLHDPGTVEKLRAVSGIRKGERSDVKERPKVQPVSDEVVKQTLPFLPTIVRDIVQLQRLTGARCQEICDMRWADIDRSKSDWLYVPLTHKNSNRDKERRIYLIPQAQAILQRYEGKSDTSYIFDPREQVRLTQQEQAEKFKQERNGRPAAKKPPRSENPERLPGDHYTTQAVRRAIHRACDRCFKAPEGLPEERIKEWEKSHRWSPHQIRHLVGTKLRREFGLDVSQAALGHTDSRTTEKYAEPDEQAAIEALKKIA